MKIAYLHGLESNNVGPKNDWLRTIASDVYDPKIDYRKKGIYQKILKEVKDFAPDIIIGSSMGGYFAYKISKTLSIPALLFNPALHSRSIQPDMTGEKSAWNNPRTHIVFGKKDDVVDPQTTLNLIDTTRVTHKTLGHGHQTPGKVFIDAVKEFIR